jgi:hypothetical protein
VDQHDEAATEGEPHGSTDVGGDSACWLNLLCESCGALIAKPGDPHRPGFDAGGVSAK